MKLLPVILTKTLNVLKFGLLVFILFFVFQSCDSRRVFDESITLQNQEWNRAELLKYKVNIDDTLALNNFFVVMRNTSDYPFSNIYFFMNTHFPDGKIARDTLECFLADQDGKWLGKASGSLWTCKVLFRQGFRFPTKGSYTFELEQAMRVVNLKGLSEIGIRIEKMK